MEPTGPIAQRFPLIARPRPACTALPARIGALAQLANRAAQDGDLTAASRVFNQAALIASDCDQPDLAREWCHRHAHAYLNGTRLDGRTARLALEPLVNLARLHIRAGDGDGGYQIIDRLYEAVTHGADTVIDGLTVPVAALTSAPELHRELCQWLWGVHLADGTRALTTAGHWNDAETHLRHHNGIGRRMLDGRQVAVIAHATNGQHTNALHLLAETEPGEPWETAVTICLTALIRHGAQAPTADDLDTIANRYRHLQLNETPVVFRTRLGLSIIDVTPAVDHPVALAIARDVILAILTSRDGYAARDLLAHRVCVSASTAEQAQKLATVLDRSGLGRPLPPPSAGLLQTALVTSEAVIVSTLPDLRAQVRGGRRLPVGGGVVPSPGRWR